MPGCTGTVVERSSQNSGPALPQPKRLEYHCRDSKGGVSLDEQDDTQMAKLRDEDCAAPRKGRWSKPVLHVLELGATQKAVFDFETASSAGPS